MGRESSFADSQFYGVTSDASFEMGLVFVIMSFGEKNKDVYSAIKDECRKIGLKAVRVDEVVGSGLVLKNIMDLIERAEFLIVDLTDEKPNVYYELGYTHGVGNEECDILLVANEGTKLHFDIAPLAIKFYTSTEHLRRIVSEQLTEMIKITRKKYRVT